MDTIQLGIIGVGNMGTGHIGNIRNGLCPEVTVTAVADIDPAVCSGRRRIWIRRWLGSIPPRP